MGQWHVSRAGMSLSQGGGTSAFPKFLGPYLRPNGSELERINLVWQHMRGNSVFLSRQPRPLPRRRGPIIPEFLEPTTCAHIVEETTEQQPNFARWSNYTWGKFLHGRPRMLTRDLFAVANVLVFPDTNVMTLFRWSGKYWHQFIS